MHESKYPRYRDNDGSRFYRAGGLSPEETWRTLGDELGRVLLDTQRAFWRTPLDIDPERVRWWHGAIFARHFPYVGGRFRSEKAFFGVTTEHGGMRQIEGSSPKALRRDLREVCISFNLGVKRLGDPNVDVLERTHVAGSLYAGILRVHPFIDGNHRTAFVALSAALWSLGLPAVEFLAEGDMTDHDDAIASAFVLPTPNIEPFAQLLATRIERARESSR